jgi:butyrate kinase
LPQAEFRVLAINPGSTSTKVALYLNERADFAGNIRHSDAEMAQFQGCAILAQQQFRSAQIEAASPRRDTTPAGLMQ